ncbi:MAG: PaaI family thioesterase [Anaerolineales bacterium]|nr:PaaI family thioesterase [Anaerolineales bacterium]MDW8448149.1 PaaI family thioesterase [Anaerolineales bacterium]
MALRQANSRGCFICGLENPAGLRLVFYEEQPGEVFADVLLEPKYEGFPGMAHGGVVAAMLDEACGRALMGSDPRNPRFMYTARLEIRYRQPVPLNRRLRLQGKALQDRGRIATAEAALLNAEGKVLADAKALLVGVPEEVYRGVDLESVGWKVYPEEAK